MRLGLIGNRTDVKTEEQKVRRIHEPFTGLVLALLTHTLSLRTTVLRTEQLQIEVNTRDNVSNEPNAL